MIEVEHLTKAYGPRVVVDDAGFHCAPGTVTGFLGPNGAGKSTTLRMIVGLVRPTSGSATVHGHRFRDLPNPGRTVGVMLDAEGIAHGGRTGGETLRLAARVLDVPAARVDALLARVGLTEVSRRRVRAYSLGMRQRLGIALALLGDPTVLVLDEPANGLDPEGIRWMRTLLREFAAGGGTVLLSSHLLAEVEATVDRLVVIGGGRIVADGAVTDLLGGSGTIVRGADGPAAGAALTAAGLAATARPDGTWHVATDPATAAAVLAAAGQTLLELRPADNLEDWFLAHTSGGSA